MKKASRFGVLYHRIITVSYETLILLDLRHLGLVLMCEKTICHVGSIKILYVGVHVFRLEIYVKLEYV